MNVKHIRLEKHHYKSHVIFSLLEARPSITSKPPPSDEKTDFCHIGLRWSPDFLPPASCMMDYKLCDDCATLRLPDSSSGPAHMNGVCFAQPSHCGLCVSALLGRIGLAEL